VRIGPCNHSCIPKGRAEVRPYLDCRADSQSAARSPKTPTGGLPYCLTPYSPHLYDCGAEVSSLPVAKGKFLGNPEWFAFSRNALAANPARFVRTGSLVVLTVTEARSVSVTPNYSTTCTGPKFFVTGYSHLVDVTVRRTLYLLPRGGSHTHRFLSRILN
jgi:hypothetical protein